MFIGVSSNCLGELHGKSFKYFRILYRAIAAPCIGTVGRCHIGGDDLPKAEKVHDGWLYR